MIGRRPFCPTDGVLPAVWHKIPLAEATESSVVMLSFPALPVWGLVVVVYHQFIAWLSPGSF